MTAKEYYDAYATYLMNSLTQDDYFNFLFDSFCAEVEFRMINMNSFRHHFVESSAKIVREVNDKWNALIHLFEKRNPQWSCMLEKDAIKLWFILGCPELKQANIGRDWP